MGHGFHYVHPNTAMMYLRASIQVQRAYPDFLRGQEKPFKHPIRHGRYLLQKIQIIHQKKFLHTYQLLQEEYQRLVDEDPENEVFGPPKDFFRVLEPHEYSDVVNMKLVVKGLKLPSIYLIFRLFLNTSGSKLNQIKDYSFRAHTCDSA